MRIASAFILTLVMTVPSVAQQKKAIDFSRFPHEKTIEAYNRDAVIFKEDGVYKIKLNEGDGSGVLWLDSISFIEGTIDIDLRGRDVQGKSFVGVAFHGVNNTTYDAVYFRPFNFQTSDPVRRIHAVQYISEPEFPWKRLRDEKNGQYEKAVTPVPDPTRWFHAKIVVKDNQVNVFVNDSKEPSLVVTKLNTRKSGKFGLWVGDGSNGDFSNLIITPNH